jgi:hypothetical protein
MFDSVQYTGTYLLTPFAEFDPAAPVTPRAQRTPTVVPAGSPVPQPSGPAITIVWHHDGKARDVYEFPDAESHHRRVLLQEGSSITICTDRSDDLAAIDASTGVCFHVGDVGPDGTKLDRGEHPVISTLPVAGEEAYCHGSGDNAGNCYANDGVLLYARSVAFVGSAIELGLNIQFKRDGLDLFEGGRRTRYELRAVSVTRGLGQTDTNAPYEVRPFPGFAKPECPTAVGTGLSAQFSEACVRSLVTFTFRWPRLLDDYEEPRVTIDTATRFEAAYFPRVSGVRPPMLLAVSKHDGRKSLFFPEHEHTETVAGMAVVFQDDPIHSLSAEHPQREAIWSDGATDYVLSVETNTQTSPDDELRRFVEAVLR